VPAVLGDTHKMWQQQDITANISSNKYDARNMRPPQLDRNAVRANGVGR
jgi:hypothetical protein